MKVSMFILTFNTAGYQAWFLQSSWPISWSSVMCWKWTLTSWKKKKVICFLKRFPHLKSPQLDFDMLDWDKLVSEAGGDTATRIQGDSFITSHILCNTHFVRENMFGEKPSVITLSKGRKAITIWLLQRDTY